MYCVVCKTQNIMEKRRVSERSHKMAKQQKLRSISEITLQSSPSLSLWTSFKNTSLLFLSHK